MSSLRLSPVPANDYEEDALEFLLGAPPAPAPDHEMAVLEVGQVWGDVLLDVQHHLAGSPAVRLGEGSDCSFYSPADTLPREKFPLFSWEEGRWVARVHPEWSGFVERGETRRAISAIAASGAVPTDAEGFLLIPLEGETRLAVDPGSSLFVARLARPDVRLRTPWKSRLDTPLIATMLLIGSLASLLVLLIATTPPALASDAYEVPTRYVEMVLEKPKPEPDVPKLKKDTPKDDEGARAKKAEGKSGKPDAKQKVAKGDRVQLKKKEMDRELAESSGLLGAIRDGAAPDVFGSSALSSTLTNGVGGLIGANGTQIGSGGLGGRGSGLGGGGQAEGIGGLGTNGKGGGKKGYGTESGDWGIREEGKIKSVGGEPILIGNMDSALIDAVIKRNMNQIRHCYQLQLTQNHDLGGKVTVKFVISKDGTVTKAETKQSTMNNASVESCINDRLMRFQFPEPKGGGIVIVSYPFMFSKG